MSDRRPYAMSRFANNVDYTPEFVEGEFEIPFIKPEVYVPADEYVPFNQARSVRSGREDKGIHFFIHDYLFEGLWSNRKKYEALLKQYRVVLTPDFSPYTDWPIMVQRWNHYRKHLLGAWMQEIGCTVYPTVTWTDEKSYAWCFDGEPWRSTVAVSSVGMMKRKEDYGLFMRGWDKMMEVLEPETILFYGKIPKECDGNIVPIETFQKRRYERHGKERVVSERLQADKSNPEEKL